MGFQMQRQPVVFLIVFQLGLRDLGVGILPLLRRSNAPFEIDSKIISSYLLLLWKTKMRKDTNLQKKVYYNNQYFPFQRNFRQQSMFQEHNQTSHGLCRVVRRCSDEFRNPTIASF